jgi:hypothetical protein
MLQQRCERSKGRAWQQGANESNLSWANWILMRMKSNDQRTRLTKPQNFECVPSNLLGRLIHDSFGWGCVVEMHPKEVEAWLVYKWITIFKMLDFPIHDS